MIYIDCLVPSSKFILEVLKKCQPKDTKLIFSAKNKEESLDKVRHLIVFGMPVDKGIINRYKNLRFVQLLTAGANDINIKALRERQILLADNNGLNSTAVAEHTISLILLLLKKIDILQDSLNKGLWQKTPPIDSLLELEGKTVGIIGLGRIGQKVAKRLLPFNVKICYFDIRNVPKSEFFNKNVKKIPLQKLLRVSDIITLHVPLTSKTHYLINEENLKIMKASSYIVNTSRGAVVNQVAVMQALEMKKLAGVALDVFEQEPLKENPFREFANVVLTPHRAGSTKENWHSRITFAFENIERYENGKTPMALL